jgi:hypothetical protein
MKTKFITLLLLLGPLFAAHKAEVYRGKIISIDEDYCNKDIDYILMATLVSKKHGTLRLALAPKWYMHRHKIEIRIGDEIEVRSLPQHDGMLHAITVNVRGKEYVLRDETGKPVWKHEPGSEDLLKNLCLK